MSVGPLYVPAPRATMPAIWHGLIARPDLEPDEWEHRLYLARRSAERRAQAEAVHMYLPSLSSRTLVYKGLMAGTRLADFYLDLKNPDTESLLAVFHQRYSTNTMPDWRLAQPFRMLAHNGEINTITGNRAWMRAREAELEPELRGAIWPEGSNFIAIASWSPLKEGCAALTVGKSEALVLPAM